VGEGKNEENGETNEKIDQPGECGRDGKNEAWEIDFRDDALVFHHDVGGGNKRGGKIGPGHDGGETENGIRETLGGKFGESAKKECGDKHREYGLKDDPHHADGGLLVADFNVTPDEKVEQLTVIPQLLQVEVEPAARRLNAGGTNTGQWLCQSRPNG